MDFEQRLKAFGDRSSSEVTGYSHFSSFEGTRGHLRFQESNKLRMVATEPLAPHDARVSVIQEFASANISDSKTARSMIVMPISQQLSDELVATGYDSVSIGKEPIFDLDEYFRRAVDPLDSITPARILRLKGYDVQIKHSSELDEADISQVRALYQKLETQRAWPLTFLSQVNPFERFEQKTFFFLTRLGKIEGYVTGLDISPIRGIYFADWVRPAQNRNGAMEFLLIESMRRLRQNGIKEVRMGMVPLYDVTRKDWRGFQKSLALRLSKWLVKKSSIYSTDGILNFKLKLSPTRWEKLYLASPEPLTLRKFFEITEAVIGKTGIDFLLQNSQIAFVGTTTLLLPRTISELIQSTRFSTLMVLAMAAIHFLQTHFSLGALSYPNVGFNAGQPSFIGFLVGPFYHDHLYHLAGDLTSFWLIGSVVEIFLSRTSTIMMAALGFWATNPIAILILKLSLGAEAFQKVAIERDYGSSNAIYAFAGGLAARISNPLWILLPFIINGAFICIGKSSWLAIHHWIGLALGYFFVKWTTRVSEV